MLEIFDGREIEKVETKNWIELPADLILKNKANGLPAEVSFDWNLQLNWLVLEFFKELGTNLDSIVRFFFSD